MIRIIKHKFNAVMTTYKGIKFRSKFEADYYKQDELRQAAGELIFFFHQVPIRLPGGVKYVIDFMEFLADGTVEFIDTKGYETPQFKDKKKIVEALYPFEIKLVKRK